MIFLRCTTHRFIFALALGVVFGMFGLVQHASAQSPMPFVPPQATHIHGKVPSGYGNVFSVEWGGGSLYQFKARLATLGCMVDSISVPNSTYTKVYRQYNTHATVVETNKEFLRRYEQFIPVGQVLVSCFEVCKMKYAGSFPNINAPQCKTFEDERENRDSIFSDLSFQEHECTQNFQHFTPDIARRVPTQPNVCIIYITIPDLECEDIPEYYRSRCEAVQSNTPNVFAFIESGFESVYRGQRVEIYPTIQPIVAMHAPEKMSAYREKHYQAILHHLELHEMCHAQQYWYIIQSLNPHTLPRDDWYDMWVRSPAGKEFLDIVGYSFERYSWILPEESVYQDIYNPAYPEELAAELCAMYLVDLVGQEDNIYTYVYFDENTGFYWRPTPTEFQVDAYLTPEIRQWIEKWIVLPDTNELSIVYNYF